MTVHERPVGATVEWYTPASLFDALLPADKGLGWVAFDLDPAAGRDGEECDLYNKVPARRKWTAVLDGLSKPWEGHVWLNPPYGPAGVAFVDRMIYHGDGLLLLPSRTETRVYQRALANADLACFLRDRLWFTRNDGATGRSSFGSTLFAFGEWAVDRLDAADLGVLAPASPRQGEPVELDPRLRELVVEAIEAAARIGLHFPALNHALGIEDTIAATIEAYRRYPLPGLSTDPAEPVAPDKEGNG